MTDFTNDQRNGAEEAFPGQPFGGEGYPTSDYRNGLTKRELFAAMAMQGMLAGDDGSSAAKYVAEEALKQADALLAALERLPPDRHHGGTTVEEREGE